MKGSGGFFAFWVSASNTFNKLRNDDELRPKTVRMGVNSIVMTVVACVFTFLGGWGALTCFNLISSGDSFLLPLLGLILSLAAAIGGLARGFICSLMYWIYQLRLNKKPIGYVALALWILGIVGVVVAIILITG